MSFHKLVITLDKLGDHMVKSKKGQFMNLKKTLSEIFIKLIVNPDLYFLLDFYFR